MNLEVKTNSRRTFAIILHLDAGNTTLTEKFLLSGGAVHLGAPNWRRDAAGTRSRDGCATRRMGALESKS